jgi:FkbM family methyltransferase
MSSTADVFPRTPLQRLRRFMRISSYEKSTGIARHWRDYFPNSYVLLRLPTQVWWLAGKSSLDHRLLHATEMEFERAELNLVNAILRPGMTFVDIGAHHGLYTLFASRLVGRKGKVVAIEPSPRERARLRKNLLLNATTNVKVESCALGSAEGEATLYLVDGHQDWCNSLRPPAERVTTRPLRVPVRRLDEFTESFGGEIDFIKLDAEGGELDILKGARKILQRRPRPIVLTEAEDIRTQPWGYKANEILRCLAELGYLWFAVRKNGELVATDPGSELDASNFLAVPEEKSDLLPTALLARR